MSRKSILNWSSTKYLHKLASKCQMSLMEFAAGGFKETGFNDDMFVWVDLITFRDNMNRIYDEAKPMTERNFHIQCQLERGDERQTAYIPEAYAVEGNYVKLRDEEKVWHDGWKVVGLGNRLPSHEVRERENDYKKTREATDIKRSAERPGLFENP